MSSEIPDDVRQKIIEAIFTERKIQAVKYYREATGSDLAAAKDFIEQLTDQLREQSPDKFKPLTSDTAQGCGTSAVLFLAVAITIIGWSAHLAG